MQQVYLQYTKGAQIEGKLGNWLKNKKVEKEEELKLWNNKVAYTCRYTSGYLIQCYIHTGWGIKCPLVYLQI